ncbi:MurR/RpiR family transcriptional regulator [Clostridium saccharobutylicum]|uniref:Uncharacterized protein n=1 Tax=Clostridium saccharobutylicum DSM 13864 TaxID=1345695 RepID=U5MVL4_CLOSA|nr:MurR/RpiR family transcriptional regulator [Clostridium saccharobutylicum]AGX44573.1 hypothetical protein CLSA_c36120 [Clostridium saccharobutylicum DSM 13864]AQR91863.1 putative HTH-type transcriptional regulator YbbH [Clostridium saccharobutylicum]AQS01765.1 putative HTH-type transcriptional regulator YbbH [Clostridium saccharobutylicum]AQS15748.1 putative HTH-type transcriptional regulator YbbH [Clostridium saccharobutylicum]MBA2906563.1 DNA-binding MurR/RpiR family transcriptional regul
MLLINKMENANLTTVEKDIAKYIIDHQEELEKLSTRAIAKATYTSSAAVIRLAHKLGFEGYNDLKKQYLEEKVYLNSHFENIDANIPFSQDNNIMSVAGAIKEVMIESANDTLSLIHHESLQQAIKILHKSNHIYVFGFGAYVPLATIFQMKMSRIKKHVVVQSFVGEESYQADMLNQDDCAIIISYSGENSSLINVASLLKENNIPIIVITSIGENSLSSYSMCLLYMSTREKLFSKIANYTSEYSVALILDILYSCYFRLNYQKNLDYKIKHSKKVEVTHFSENEIIKE